jgi:hypothetical protein
MDSEPQDHSGSVLLHPLGAEPASYPREVRSLTSWPPEARARSASMRHAFRTAWFAPSEPDPPEGPFDWWLQEVEDKCFQAGREEERRERAARRPHKLVWYCIIGRAMNLHGKARRVAQPATR